MRYTETARRVPVGGRLAQARAAVMGPEPTETASLIVNIVMVPSSSASPSVTASGVRPVPVTGAAAGAKASIRTEAATRAQAAAGSQATART